MGTPEKVESFEDLGNPYPAPTSYKERGRHLSCEFRECGVVVRAGTSLQQFSNRREQPIQGQLDQEIQGTEKAPEELPKANYPDWYTNTTGFSRPVGSGGYIGLRHEVRNFFDQVQGQVHVTGSDEPPHEGGIQLEDETRRR